MSNKTKLYQDNEWLYEQYTTLKKNSVQIAKECGMNSLTIRNWLKKFNIRIRTKSEGTGKKYQNKDYLFYNYITLDKHLVQIAKECEVSCGTILNWLRKFNIRKIKCNILELENVQNKMYHCRAYLFCVHDLLGLSLKEIAKENGVTYTTIHNWLKKTKTKNKQRKQITCELCGQIIFYHKIESIFKIINIRQKPAILYFCDRKCRLQFIDNLQKKG